MIGKFSRILSMMLVLSMLITSVGYAAGVQDSLEEDKGVTLDYSQYEVIHLTIPDNLSAQKENSAYSKSELNTNKANLSSLRQQVQAQRFEMKGLSGLEQILLDGLNDYEDNDVVYCGCCAEYP